MWFANKDDYSRIGSGDTIETIGLEDAFKNSSSPILLRVTKRDGEIFDIATKHTMSEDQLKWLRAGSALNYIRSQL